MPFKLDFLSFIGFPILISLAIYLGLTSSSTNTSYKSTVYADTFSQITDFTMNLLPDFYNQTFIGMINLHINITLTNFRQFKKVCLDMNDETIMNISVTNNLNVTFYPYYIITAITDDPNVEKNLGRKLTINIPPDFFLNYSSNSTNSDFYMMINYTTSNNRNGRGINWLQPSQTYSQKYPFFFTFCRPYRCRSLAPMQDSLLMSANYNITITVPSPMIAVVATSQVAITPNFDVSSLIVNFTTVPYLDYTNWTQYLFTSDNQTTPYLLNIAIGVFEQIELIPGQAYLLAETEIIDICINSLANISGYLATANAVLNSTYPFNNGLTIMVMPMAYMEDISVGTSLMFVPLARVLNPNEAKTTVWELFFSSYWGVLNRPLTWSDWYIIRGFSHYLNEKAKEFEDVEWGILSNNVTASILLDMFNELCSNPATCIFTELTPNLNGEDENVFDHLLVAEYKGYFSMLFLRDQMNNLNNMTGNDNFMNYILSLINNTSITSFDHMTFMGSTATQLENMIGAKQSIQIRKNILWTKWWTNHLWDQLPNKNNASTLTQNAIDLANLYFNNSMVTDIQRQNFSNSYLEAKVAFFLYISSGTFNESLVKLLDSTYNFSSSNDCTLMQSILDLKIDSYNYSVTANSDEIVAGFISLAKNCGYRDTLETEFGKLNDKNSTTLIQRVFSGIENMIHPFIRDEFALLVNNSVPTRFLKESHVTTKVAQFLKY